MVGQERGGGAGVIQRAKKHHDDPGSGSLSSLYDFLMRLFGKN